MPRYVFALALLVLLAAGPALAFFGDDDSMPIDKIAIKTQGKEVFLFNVEVAKQPRDQQKGLMKRKSMAEDAGMLFVFETEGKPVFWMKDTLIPLDMIFIANDGTINHIHPMARPLDEARITSSKPAHAVLELNGGLCDRLGIKEGDMVIHGAFKNVNRF